MLANSPAVIPQTAKKKRGAASLGTSWALISSDVVPSLHTAFNWDCGLHWREAIQICHEMSHPGSPVETKAQGKAYGPRANGRHLSSY